MYLIDGWTTALLDLNIYVSQLNTRQAHTQNKTKTH